MGLSNWQWKQKHYFVTIITRKKPSRTHHQKIQENKINVAVYANEFLCKFIKHLTNGGYIQLTITCRSGKTKKLQYGFHYSVCRVQPAFHRHLIFLKFKLSDHEVFSCFPPKVFVSVLTRPFYVKILLYTSTTDDEMIF